MKKLLTTICFILVFSMVFSSVCYAAGDNYDTLADWNIKIAVPDDTTAVLKGNEYYIYAQSVGWNVVLLDYERLFRRPEFTFQTTGFLTCFGDVPAASVQFFALLFGNELR